ncbi:MAG: hypothetical protein HC938_16265 [Nitrospira sp.]|nr:hypothetical protein [Nitrospira sp.]
MCAQADLIAVRRFPEPIGEHVVAPATLALHAGGDSMLREQADEVRAGELAALVATIDI